MLVSDHPIFWALGNTPFQREANYKEMIAASLSKKEINLLSESTNKGWMLGSAAFKIEMEKLSERRVEPARPGRPRKLVSA